VKVVKDVKVKNLRTFTVAAGLVLVAACGGNKPAEAPTAATTAAARTAQAAPPAAAPQPKPSATPAAPLPTVTPVAFEQLLALLPEMSGWTRSAPRGEQVRMDFVVSRAEAQYESGESLVRLEVTDSALSPLVLAPISMMLVPNYGERSSSGYRKAVSVNASPGFETWRNADRDAEVAVLIAGRFLVSGRGHNVDNPGVVRGIVEAVDLRKLAGLQ
jgi:hypothetical protein